eukprot:9851502-Alexandrium_andersonii.AAC.1
MTGAAISASPKTLEGFSAAWQVAPQPPARRNAKDPGELSMRGAGPICQGHGAVKISGVEGNLVAPRCR